VIRERPDIRNLVSAAVGAGRHARSGTIGPMRLAATLLVLAPSAPAWGQPIVDPGRPPVVAPAPQAVPVVNPAAAPAAARTSRIVTGSVLLGITHGAGVAIGSIAGASDPDAYWLALPLAGPVVWGATTDCDWGKECNAALITLGAFWAALQLGGLIVLVLGATERPAPVELSVAPRLDGLAIAF